MRRSALCDTICVWAFYFKDSAYREHMLKLRSNYLLIIPDICFLEASYPIYEAKGLKELEKYSKFVENIFLARNIKVLSTSLDDLVKALNLATSEPETFIDDEGNLCLFDALIASTWMKANIPLITSDSRLMKFGASRNLKIIKLRKTKRE